ncbi:MAG: beta-ketoacyl-ACP synthase, partial [Aphanizomenon sp.]
QPEYNLNFIISAQESKIQQVLCLSFGFGGQNAVIALGNLKNS